MEEDVKYRRVRSFLNNMERKYLGSLKLPVISTEKV
jgi:hypothetical protein